MSDTGLQNAFKLDPQNRVTLSKKSLDSALESLITTYYQGLSIVISNATLADADDGSESVVISGVSSILNVTDVPVTARFRIDNTGQVQAILRYQMRPEGAQSVNAWTFSHSFPTLPAVLNYDTELSIAGDDALNPWVNQIPFLDSLALSDTYLVVTTQDGEDPDFQVPLQTGINVVSKLRAGGALGILANSLGMDTVVKLYGGVRLPKVTDQIAPLKSLERAWDRPEAPGIHLQAALEIDMKLGQMVFDQVFFRLYSPISTDWLATNPTFQPMHGYTGLLQIPSADIEVALSADLKWGMPEAVLFAKCDGVTLGKLSQLIDMAGTDDLSSNLPQELQAAVEKLETLELMTLGLSLELVGAAPIIRRVSATIGMPTLNWQVWDNHFEVRSIASRFDIQNPFGKLNAVASAGGASEADQPALSVTITGTMAIEGVPVTISAKSDDHFTLYAKLGGEQTIPLKALMKRYVPGVPPPSDLTIDSMALTVAPGQLYAMSAAVAGQPKPWVIPVGPSGLTISDVMMNVQYPAGGPVSGSFSGSIVLGDDIVLAMRYDLPGDIVIRGVFESIKLSQVINALCNQTISMPSGFDLDFVASSVLIRKQGNAFVFQLASQIEGFGYVALEVKKVASNNRWGLATGLSIVDAKPSQLPGLGFLQAFEKAVDLQDFTLVLSTYDGVEFKFPNMERFGNPNLTAAANVPLPAQAGGLVAGLNVYAKWRLDTRRQDLKLLQTILGLDPELGVTLQLGQNPAQDARLFLQCNTQLAGQWPLQGQFGLVLKAGKPELFLAGSCDVTIQRKPCRFDVAMSLVKGGVYMAGSMQGTVKFGDLQLSNLALALGVNWAGIPSFGIAASLDIDGFSSSVALMFDSTDPSKSVLAGAISDVSLREIADSLAGAGTIPDELEDILDDIELTGTQPFNLPTSLSTALDDMDLAQIASAFAKHGKITLPDTSASVLLVVGKTGQEWSLTDLSNNMRHYQLKKMNQSIRVTQNPQLYIAPNGAQLGKLVFTEGFFMTGSLNILGMKWTSQVDIQKRKGIAASSQLNKALVVYKPQFFQLSDVQGKTGPLFSVSTFSQPQLETKAFRKPHVYLNGRLSLVGLTSESYVKATKNGFAFSLVQARALSIPGRILSGSVSMEVEIHGAFDSIKNFNAGGDIALSLSGKIDLSQLDILGKAVSGLGKVSVELSVAGGMEMGYDGKKAYVTFSGQFEFQKIHHSFTLELSASNADLTKAGEMVINELQDILKDLLGTAEAWVNAVEEGLVAVEKGAEQMADVLKNGYDKAAKDTLVLMSEAGQEFDDIGRAFQSVYGTSAKDMGQLMNQVGAEADEIAGTLKNVYTQSSRSMIATLKVIGVDGKAIGHALKLVYKPSAANASKLLSQAGIRLSDIGSVLHKAYQLDANAAAKTLKSASKTGPQIAGVLKSSYKQSATQMAKVLNRARVPVHDIGNALKTVYGVSARDASKTLKGIGQDAEAVASIMKRTYKLSAKDTGNLLKETFKLDKGDIQSAMKSAGYASKEIDQFIGSAFNSIKNVFDGIF